MSTLARLDDLRVHGPAGRLLGPIDLHIAAGERVGLVGASGSGKTLTASVLLGEPLPGLEVTGERSLHGAAGQRVTGAVFQESALALNPLVRVGRQLGLPLRAAGLTRDERRRRVMAQLEGLGLPARTARSWPLELSGGQRQRVALGLALIGAPGLLVADEPTSALDGVTQHGVLTTMARLLDERGSALLLISHDLALVGRMCDRVLVMHQGLICEEGPPDRLLADPRHDATRRLARAARLLGVTA